MFSSESALAKPQLLEGSMIVVLMTTARMLRSRMKRKFHVRFCTGGGVGNHPTDQNLGKATDFLSLRIAYTANFQIDFIGNSDMIGEC